MIIYISHCKKFLNINVNMITSNSFLFQIIRLLVVFVSLHRIFAETHYHFEVKEVPYTRLCSTKNIMTVNGQFPGPTIYAHKGDIIYVNVYNNGRYNITIHWHGVELPRYPWSDGPEYITQCPIQPGAKFRQKIIFSTEEGTLWWHAHSDWMRASVYGAIVVYPKNAHQYPFPKPHAEVPILLGEWWKSDVKDVFDEFVESGGGPNISDAYTINGQPGALYPCSKSDIFKLKVEKGKTYQLRLINANMNQVVFYKIAKHNLTVVGADGYYTKPLETNIVAIAPGQTMDLLLRTNRSPNQYFMAARALSSNPAVPFDNTTTAIVEYCGNYLSSPSFPELPYYNDTKAAFKFFGSLRSLANEDHPIDVPIKITKSMFITLSINTHPCTRNSSCEGPNRTMFATSMNNISFVTPTTSILKAYYNHINGVYGNKFPNVPPYFFNFTGSSLPNELQTPERGTEVKILPYNSTIEIVFQVTNVTDGSLEHPMHLHGNSFYVVGSGLGNFDKDKDPKRYNLKDPPIHNTVAVPPSGWATIRWKAHNPGVWYMHCHFERHLTWAMMTVFIVKNGKHNGERLLPPPPDMPPC